MGVIEKILVPIDFTENSLRAFKHSTRLAYVFDADIEVLYVHEEDNEYVSKYFSEDDISTFINGKKRISLLDEIAEKKRYDVARISYNMCHGNVKDEIINFVNVNKIDLISLGAQGTNNVSKYFFGNVTTYLMEHSPVPVYAIPSKFPHKKRFRNVSIATSLDREDYEMAEVLLQSLKDIYKINFSSVHIDTNHIVEFSDKFKRWKDTFSPKGVKCFLVDDGNFLRGLDGFVQKKNIDTVVIQTYANGLFNSIFNESIARQVMYQKITCVLGVPRKYIARKWHSFNASESRD